MENHLHLLSTVFFGLCSKQVYASILGYPLANFPELPQDLSSYNCRTEYIIVNISTSVYEQLI